MGKSTNNETVVYKKVRKYARKNVDTFIRDMHKRPLRKRIGYAMRILFKKGIEL